MRDFFRLKLVSKRQVTIPQLMLEKLHLQEGDELEFEIENGSIVAVRPMKLVPTDFFNESMLRKLQERSRSMDAGEKVETGMVPVRDVPSRSVEVPATATARAEQSRSETKSVSGY